MVLSLFNFADVVYGPRLDCESSRRPQVVRANTSWSHKIAFQTDVRNINVCRKDALTIPYIFTVFLNALFLMTLWCYTIPFLHILNLIQFIYLKLPIKILTVCLGLNLKIIYPSWCSQLLNSYCLPTVSWSLIYTFFSFVYWVE